MWGGPIHAYGAVMQFSTDRFDVGPGRCAADARPSRGTAAVLPVLITVIVSALAAVVLAGIAQADGLPSGQLPSEQQLNEYEAAPTEVINAFLAAQSVDDVDTAAAFFEADASITDSTGRSAFGTDAVRHLIYSLNGLEAGPRHATGHEVIWAESLPNWQPSAAPTDLDLLLEQEVPHYAFTQVMCAVVTDAKIHALITLAASSPRSCESALT